MEEAKQPGTSAVKLQEPSLKASMASAEKGRAASAVSRYVSVVDTGVSRADTSGSAGQPRVTKQAIKKAMSLLMLREGLTEEQARLRMAENLRQDGAMLPHDIAKTTRQLTVDASGASVGAVGPADNDDSRAYIGWGLAAE